jgi:hypothetical protein
MSLVSTRKGRKETMVSSLSILEMLGAFPHVDVVALGGVTLAIAALLLVLWIVVDALVTWMVNRRVEHIRRGEKSRQSHDREATFAQAAQCLTTLSQSCFELESSLCNGGTYIREKKGLPALPYSIACEVIGPSLKGELKAFEKALDRVRLMLWTAEVPTGLVEFCQEWCDDLYWRFEEAWCDVSLALQPSIVEALRADALEVWQDTIALTQTEKPTLLSYLQYSMLQEQRAFAEAKRALTRQGSDAQWSVAGWYHTMLIHWAASDAIRRILRAREMDQDLTNSFTVGMLGWEFAQTLTRKCDDDQLAFFRALKTFELPVAPVALPA